MVAMSPHEAREFKARWTFVNRFIAQEVRNTPAQIKLQQIQTLFNSGWLFHALTKEVDEVRSRWNRLKDNANG